MDLFGDGLLFLFGKCLGMELLSDVKVYLLLLMDIWVSQAFAIINSVATNSSVQRYFFFLYFCWCFFGIEVGYLVQKANADLVLLDVAKFPFTGIVPFCIPISNVREFLFLHSFIVTMFCEVSRFLFI